MTCKAVLQTAAPWQLCTMLIELDGLTDVNLFYEKLPAGCRIIRLWKKDGHVSTADQAIAVLRFA